MEGYEIYRLSDEEIQHFGVKGMKWGKRKSRSAYMKKVDAHENKTKSVAAAKSASGSAKRKAYMDAVRANDNKGKAKRKAYMDAVNAHEQKGKDIANAKAKEKSDKKAINAESSAKRAARIQLAKDSIENYKKSLVKSLDDPMVKALVASSIYANNSYSMDSTRTGANAHRQMFY